MRIYKYLPTGEKFLFFLCIFVISALTVYTFTGFNLSMNSDAAIANIIAEEIVRTGRYFPPDWNYGTSLWIFGVFTLVVPLTYFVENWLVARSIACIVFIILAIASCVYCSSKIFKNNMWLVAVPLLFCGIGAEYSEVVFGQCAYIHHLIYPFIITALFIDSLDENFHIRSKIKFIICLVFTAFIHLGGVVSVQAIGLPLIGAIVLMIIVDKYNYNVKTAVESEKPMLIKLLLVLMAMVFGIATHFILRNVIGTPLSDEARYFSNGDFFDRLKIFYNLFINTLDMQNGVSVFSYEGVTNVIKLVAGILLLIVFPILQVRKFKHESKSIRFFILFSVIHIAEIVILSLFADVLLFDSSRYLFSSMILLICLSANYIYKHILCRIKSFGKLLTIVALAIYILIFATPKFTSFVGYSNAIDVMRDVTTHLSDRNLHFGYATFWNAYKNTVLSNGDVEINAVNISSRIEPYYWLNSSQRYTEEAYQGQTFLLLTPEENKAFISSHSYEDLGQVENYEEYGGYCIYTYDYNISANEFIGKPWDDKELIKQMVCDENKRNYEGIVLCTGDIVFGPYVDVQPGKYQINIDFGKLDEPISYHLSSDAGCNIFQDGIIKDKNFEIMFETDKILNDFEIVFGNSTKCEAVIASIRITDISISDN